MLKIALPNKGRLADETRELFDDAGLDVRARRRPRAHRLARRRVRGALRPRAGHPGVRRRRRGRRGRHRWDLVGESERELDRCSTSSSAAAGWWSPRARTAASRSSTDIGRQPRVATVFPAPHAPLLRARRAAGRDRAGFGRRRDRATPRHRRHHRGPHVDRVDAPVNGLREIATVLESTRPSRDRRPIAQTAPTKSRALDELVAALDIGAARARQALRHGERAARRARPVKRGPARAQRADGDRHPERRPQSPSTRSSRRPTDLPHHRPAQGARRRGHPRHAHREADAMSRCARLAPRPRFAARSRR